MHLELKTYWLLFLFYFILYPGGALSDGIDANDLGSVSLPELQNENKLHMKHLHTGITSIYGPPTASQASIGPDAVGVTVNYDKDNGTSNNTKADPSKLSFKFYVKYPLQEPGFSFKKEDVAKLNMWPEAKVPYYIDSFSFDSGLRDKIREFLSDASVKTGLHFTELAQVPDDKMTLRWVLFLNRRQILECEHYTSSDFSEKKLQDVVLGYDCINDRGKMAGLVLALAGIPPMHNAPDRDKYIDVKTDEAIPELKQLFNKIDEKKWLFSELPYDFKSAGHFHSFKHSQNGKSTIEPKVYTDVDIGYANDFSPIDILKVRMMYNNIAKSQSNFDSKPCKKLFSGSSSVNGNARAVGDSAQGRPVPKSYLESNNFDPA